MNLEILTELSAHNLWANQRIFDACSELETDLLYIDTHGYESVFGILTHLVQVEYSFFELAHGRKPQQIGATDLDKLQSECSRIDTAYIRYIKELTPDELENKRFLIPWFGFEISILQAIIQPLTHSHKHRADVSMLLPLLGGAGIEMDYIQWLAERKAE